LSKIRAWLTFLRESGNKFGATRHHLCTSPPPENHEIVPALGLIAGWSEGK
jgi:hypothetical protein